MSRAYNCIDADGHILEPLELWAQYMDPKYRDHAPRLVRDNQGKERLLIGQKTLGSERGMLLRPLDEALTSYMRERGDKRGEADGPEKLARNTARRRA